ncbi:histone-like nucleoid-structuring protein, MvaT/MvaU family [Pseudomonas sp. BN607]|uniref:histone-like nucleoid-structuring protein, MvaT/MvaU family n=1 Tax=Pseudomonas sp. BN607 TaxID=2567895 RepID=UPI002453AC8F|nr:histone-like nucleoid-structuring protein, MvaT/MvaU family [Pseudomonas sp. BN607]MDH4552135.1 transcriptional regulator [Pseudomonas sp. BN607]
MSRLAEFRALEWLLATKKSELQFIKVNPQLMRELEFESKLNELLAEYKFSLWHVLSIFEHENQSTLNAIDQQPLPLPAPPRYRTRQSKYYKNPHTGEVVAAKNTLNNTVRSWIEQYGRSEVESWATAWSVCGHQPDL